MSNEEQTALVALGMKLADIERSLTPELVAVVGKGFTLEIQYSAASFRQRFPDYWPGGQQALL